MPGQARSTTIENELALRAQRGDRQAYGELVSRCRDSVVGLVYRYCGDAGLAEETAQEAFLRAWQHLDSYRPHRSFRAWVLRIAINTVLDALRRADNRLVRQSAGLDEMPLTSQDPGPEDSLVQGERDGLVRQAVLDLPQSARAALVLREFGGLTYAEIAEVLNIPLGTVMSRLNAARTELRQRLARQLEVQ